MTAYTNVLEMIGKTPMVELRQLDTGPCQLFVKLEMQNPGGSIKDRIGLAMIEAAEADGSLEPGGTIVEATAGNTGLGLGLFQASYFYIVTGVIARANRGVAASLVEMTRSAGYLAAASLWFELFRLLASGGGFLAGFGSTLHWAAAISLAVFLLSLVAGLWQGDGAKIKPSG